MRENGGIPPPFGGSGYTLVLPPNTGTFIKWGLILIGVISLFAFSNILRGVYTDWLWFNNLGFLDVFTTILWTRTWLFIAGAAVFGAMITVNVVLAHRHARGESVLPLPEDTLRWLARLLVVGFVLGAIVMTVIFGFVAASRWDQVLRLLSSTQFGIDDPVFHNDVSFFVFTLPILELVQGWFLGAFITLFAVSLIVYQAHFALRGMPIGMTNWVRGHLAVLGALIFFDLAFKHILDRFGTVFSTGGAVFGATYADVNARVPALLLVTAIAVAAGVLLLVSLLPALRGSRGTRLILGAVGLWVAAAVLGGNVYPSFVQRFTVEPNELEKEKPFIVRNIEFTRIAFGIESRPDLGIEGIEERNYEATGEVTREEVQANLSTVYNVRLWDPSPLMDIYNQIQHLRLYYNFKDVDVDRYDINGEYRQVILGARELYPENLPPEAQRWVNQKLQFTHGYGVAASPVTEFTDEGRPEFFVKDVPPTGDIEITRPEIYYGENTMEYVIVNTNTEEFDHPTEEDVPAYVRYQGRGGVNLSSYLRKVVYAWQLGDVNILISGEITSESKIQYNRQIQERISKVAPFLMLDRDPYLVVEEGRLLWVQDAYTVSSKYPYSRPFNDDFNYIRNSVKVVVDAYHGDIEFYVMDPADPIVQTYREIFPVLFKDLGEMSPFLLSHLRYPEDLFSIQAELFLQYHMTDPTVFFNKEDQWSIPLEISFGAQQPMKPYYVIMKLPGEEKAEFVLILPFTPAEKPNMVAWLAARMDQPNYGKLLAFRFPRGEQIDGPIQVEARIDNDTEISQQFTLWDQGGSVVVRGNLLVIPIGNTILYVEPIYLRAEGIPLPELKRVILASSKKVVMEPSLDEALVALLGAPLEPEPQPPDGSVPVPSSESIKQLELIQQALGDLRDGLITLEEAVRQLAQIIEEEQ